MARYNDRSELPRGLLLCNYDPNQGAVTVESINSFLDHCRYPLFPYSLSGGFDPEFPYDSFDFIVIHYSIIPTLPGFLNDGTKDKLRDFKGPIFQFVQDDYRRHDVMRDFMNYIGTDAIYSIFPLETARRMYESIVPADKIFHYLAGYSSSFLNLEKTKPIESRKVYVGYRGREYPYWFGPTTNLKIDAAKAVAKIFTKKLPKIDFSVREKDRVYGRDWVKFIMKSRAIFGTESEVNFIDPDGSMDAWYNTVRDLNKIKGKKWDGRYVVDTDFFKDNTQEVPGDAAIIPPRVMEVMSLRSANILIEGDYSGVLKPGRHYIPIKRDLSNLDEVIATLKDTQAVATIIANAFAEIASRREYRWEGFGDILDETFGAMLADITPKPVGHVLTETQLREKAGPIYIVANPHVRTVHNPYQKGLGVFLKSKARSRWRRLLSGYRRLNEYQLKD